ncbi:uncharacterized protein LOC129602733 [Paramacrobiotus metropolitanus]|uniref:uncharacterized protein LOC129602733 n=1 Tax=Paramacrobiotus metropolitanus TaxID=2943436 RepID=UPI002445C968|nr:uncharacterized protein LOC129602733 [Paramacrobiotus metropolitanus]
MTSDETRARDTLLESDPEPIMEPTTAAPSATAHRGSVVTQMMGRATELISEVAEIIAGVVPPSLSGERLDANTMTADTAVERRAEFFINSPSMEQSISRDFPGKSDNDLEVRRNSLTPESPYNVSDETRSRKENLQDDTAGQQDADVINHGHTIRSGSLSYNYERLD